MQTYLNIAAIAIASAGLGVSTAVFILLYKLSKRYDNYDDTIDDLRQSGSANTKEVGERVAANQALLRKRIDHLEDEIKRHSTRIDLFRKQVSQDVDSAVQSLDRRITELVEGDFDTEPDVISVANSSSDNRPL